MATLEELERDIGKLRVQLAALRSGEAVEIKSQGFKIGDTRVYREEDDGHLWQRERDGTETDLAGPKVNYSAIIPPTVNDDAGDGYSISSRWIDIVGQKEYVCVDATTGAAVWIETTTDEPGGIHTHALLQASMHTDTLNQSPSLGSLVAATAAKWTELVAGSNGRILVPASGETLGLKWADGLDVTDTTGTWTLTAIGTNQAGYLYLKPSGTPGSNPHSAFRVYNQAGQYVELRAETGGLYVVSSGAQNLLLGVGTKYAFQIDTNGDVAMAYHSLSNIGPYLHVYATGEAVQYDPPLHGLQLEANATTGAEKRNSAYAKFTGHYSSNAAVNILEFLRVLTTGPTYELVWHNLTTSADIMRLGQTGILYLENLISVKEIATPGTPAAGYGYIYADTADSKPKYKDDAGTVYDLTSMSGHGDIDPVDHHPPVTVADGAHTCAADQVLVAVAAGAAQAGHVDTAAQTFAGLKTFGDGIKTDTIDEETATAGVIIDGTLIKDNAVYPLSTNLNCYFKWVAAAGGNFYFQADSGDYILYNATLNKWYFDINSTEILSLLGTGATLSVPLAMSSQKITGLAAGTAAGDAVRWEQGAIRCINIVFDGGGSEIADNTYVDVWIPWACTVMAWRLMADQAGAIKIDLWSEADGAANFPPADGNSITNAHEPEIAASDDYAEDDDVTDWSGEALAAETVLRASVDSCTTITKCTLALKVKVT